MPDYFAGYEIVAQTKNFLVTCENDVGARTRAQNVGYTCEADLGRLNDLFSTNFEAGISSPHGIWVVVLKDDPTSGANGWNYGYETQESSQIWIRRGFVPPPPPPPSLFPPDPPPLPGPNLNNAVTEFPRFVFVAELAEILMQFTGYGWSPGNSPGEGLSNLLGALLHPAGYYDAGQGPRINQWLNGRTAPTIAPRADYVTKTVNTDQDIFSYGCAILFMNYLVYQRGHALKDVIRAGGGTLAETYARLTGEPTSAAYPAFNGLLQQHIGNSTTNNLQRDNIFPLLDVRYRSIQTTVALSTDQGHLTETSPVSWDVKPGIMCPVARYDFYRMHELLEQPVFARARGMANATFRWMIEGVELPVHGMWSNIAINSPLDVENPDGSKTHVADSTSLQYGIVDVWNLSVLYLKTLSWNGNCELAVTVAAREAAVNEAEVTANESVSLTTVTWAPGDRIKEAWRRCNPFYARLNDTLWYLTQKLSDLKNRPDPPSERGIHEITQAVAEVQRAVTEYATAGQLTEDEIWRQMATAGGLRSADPVPPPVDVTGLRLQDAGRRHGPEDGEVEAH